MLTVHIVAPESLPIHRAFQESILKTTKVVAADAKDPNAAVKLARDTAVLSRKEDVVAVVPAEEGRPKVPAGTKEWLDLADEVFAVSAAKKTVVKSSIQWA